LRTYLTAFFQPLLMHLISRLRPCQSLAIQRHGLCHGGCVTVLARAHTHVFTLRSLIGMNRHHLYEHPLVAERNQRLAIAYSVDNGYSGMESSPEHLTTTAITIRPPIRNRLLAALPHAVYRRLMTQMELVTLSFGDILSEPGDPIEHVYFPENSLVSLLTLADAQHGIEVGMVGHESMVGATLALGVGASPFRVLVQGSGRAMRMKAAPFLRKFQQSLSVRQQVQLCSHALMVQIAQSVACNRFHVIEERLARCLLMTRDRVDSNDFHLTHEFLGNMLGVRRVGITKAAHALRQRKLINYSRGNIHILDGDGLEATACSCYALDGHRHNKG